MNTSSVPYSSLYYDFIALDFEIYPGIVYFYERNETEIQHLCFEEYFDILLAYTEALFQCEEFRKHIALSDVVIDTAMAYQIKNYNGQDIFLQTLFRKANAYYHLKEFNAATHILKELLHINPTNMEYQEFLKKNLRADIPPYFQHLRAMMVASFSLGTLILLTEVLVIRSFYPDVALQVEIIRNLVFFTGVVFVAIGYLLHFYKADKKTNLFITHAIAKKTRKQRRLNPRSLD
jgi:tetratricopeptide (TPR) repeat protein